MKTVDLLCILQRVYTNMISIYFYALPAFSITWVNICKSKPYVNLFFHITIQLELRTHPEEPFGASIYIKPLSEVRLDVATIPLKQSFQVTFRHQIKPSVSGLVVHHPISGPSPTQKVTHWADEAWRFGESVCINLVEYNGFQLDTKFRS